MLAISFFFKTHIPSQHAYTPHFAGGQLYILVSDAYIYYSCIIPL